MKEDETKKEHEERGEKRNLPCSDPKRISFYIQAQEGPQWQNKLTQVLLFSHYEIEGGMRRE